MAAMADAPKSSFLAIPDSVKLQILESLDDVTDLCCATRTCRQMYWLVEGHKQLVFWRVFLGSKPSVDYGLMAVCASFHLCYC